MFGQHAPRTSGKRVRTINNTVNKSDMKTLFAVLVAGLSLTLTTPVQAEQTEHGLIAVAEYEKLEQCLLDLAKVLSTVESKETADAAAPLLAEKGKALQAQMSAMSELSAKLTQAPNEEDEAAFEKCKQNLHIAGIGLQQELARLAMVEFYESEAFISALLSLSASAEPTETQN